MAAATLKELLRELEGARGLRGRLRVAARSFELLRSLDRTARERVALQMGSEWAWKQIERSFMKDGQLSEGERFVRQAFEAIGSADPEELRQAARRIRETDRDGLERAAALALEQILEEEVELEAEAEQLELDTPPQFGTIDGAPAADLTAAIQTVAQLAPSAKLESAGTRGSPLAESIEPEPSTPPAPTTSTDPARGASQRPEREPAAPLAPPPVEPRPLPALNPDTQDPAVPRTSTAAERLRALRTLRTPGHARALGREGRRRLVEGLGPGWAGRRAISAMIERAELDDLDEALSLLATLDGESSRAWCLSDWIEHRPLDEADRDRLLEAAPNAVARRRIERRLRIAASDAG